MHPVIKHLPAGLGKVEIRKQKAEMRTPLSPAEVTRWLDARYTDQRRELTIRRIDWLTNLAIGGIITLLGYTVWQLLKP